MFLYLLQDEPGCEERNCSEGGKRDPIQCIPFTTTNLWLVIESQKFPYFGNSKSQLPQGSARNYLDHLQGNNEEKYLNEEIQWYFHHKSYLIAISIRKY